MKKILTLIIIPLLLPQIALSETAHISQKHRDFLRLYHFHKPELSLRYEFHSEQEESSGPGKFDMQLFSVDLDLPVTLTEDSFINYGLSYESRMIDFKSPGPVLTLEDDIRLHKIEAEIGFGIFLTDNLFADVSASIGTYSDLADGFDEDSLKLFGKGLLVYRLNPGAQLLLGARVDETFEDSTVYPVFGIRLMDDDGRVNISLTLPVSARLSYHINKDTEVYIKALIGGNEYAVEMGPTNLSFDTRVHERRVLVGLRRWLGSHIAVGFELGSSFDSEFEFLIDNPGQFEDGELDKSYFGSVLLDLTL